MNRKSYHELPRDMAFLKTFVVKGHVKVFEIRKFIYFILEFIASNLRHSIFELISDFLL